MRSLGPCAITLAPAAVLTASDILLAEVVGALGSESTQDQRSFTAEKTKSGRDQRPIRQIDDAIAFFRKIEIVRDHKEACAFVLVHLAHELEHVVGGLAVKIAGRLVGLLPV
jgi:hypothetical protein